ncbi:MAG: type II toxin-antitoxin system VapC family toxin [Gemmatimonadota bacterium]
MIVLDASALVDVVTDQPTKPWVLERLAASSICAPSHQMAEVLSALARLVRAGVLEPSSARDALSEAKALQQELIEPTEDHLVRALAMQDRVRVLDGLYVVLAQDRAAALVSTDQRLVRGRLPVEVLAPDPA